jgi:lysozyme
MNMSRNGLIALARFEAVVLSTYRDAAGVSTIGVGHTAAAGPPEPAPGMRLTPGEALDLLRRDLRRYEAQVASAVAVALATHEFDALVSFHFNTGAIASASLVKTLNAGDRAGPAAGLMAWVNAGGRRLPGLVKRRAAERAMFERADYGDLSGAPVYDAYPGEARFVSAAELFPPEGESSSGPSHLVARLDGLEERVRRLQRAAG